MRGPSLVVVATALAATCVACALFGMGAEGQFRKEALPRAAREIGCDERKIDIREVGDKRVAIDGCGQHAEYAYIELTSGGSWVRDTGKTYDTMPGKTPPAPPSAAPSTSAAVAP